MSAAGCEGSCAVDSATASAVLETLTLDGSELRRQSLARKWRATAVEDPSTLIRSLELHGILPLIARNLEQVHGAIADGLSRELAGRRLALKGHTSVWVATLSRFLREAARRSVDVLILKGASLSTDLYPSPDLRSQGDIDVLVRKEFLGEAIDAARSAGLCFWEDQFPLFWYRIVHFHVKLHPRISLLSEIEIHWRLQSAALLKTVTLDAIWKRAVGSTFGEARVLRLDPLDEMMHLASHLKSHWGEAPLGSGHEVLLRVLADSAPPIRLKWIADLAFCLERFAVSHEGDVEALIRRAEEWNGEEDLELAVRLSLATPLSDSARRVGLELHRELEAMGFAGISVEGEKRPSPSPEAVSNKPDLARPRAGWDFRFEALGLLPGWIFPPRRYLVRQYGIDAGGASSFVRVILARIGHALLVGARVGLALKMILPALVGRRFLKSRRRRARQEPLPPEDVLDLVAGVRRRR